MARERGLTADDVLRRVDAMVPPRLSASGQDELAEAVAALPKPELDKLVADANLAIEDRRNAGQLADALIVFARLGLFVVTRGRP